MSLRVVISGLLASASLFAKSLQESLSANNGKTSIILEPEAEHAGADLSAYDVVLVVQKKEYHDDLNHEDQAQTRKLHITVSGPHASGKTGLADSIALLVKDSGKTVVIADSGQRWVDTELTDADVDVLIDVVQTPVMAQDQDETNVRGAAGVLLPPAADEQLNPNRPGEVIPAPRPSAHA